MSLTRLCWMVVLYLLSISTTLLNKNHPDKPTQNPVDQLDIGCNFPIIEFYSCPKEFPTNPPIFLDSISNENEDEEYFELIGGSILNPANPVIITVRDTSNVPGTCSDTFWTKRIYTIDDGSETLECYRTFMCLEPPVRLLKHSENIEVSCSENTDSLYNEWISNHGNLEYLACSKPVILLTEPEIPELIYSCPGNAKSEVIFKVKDSCGSWIFSQGTFEVIDSTAPEISCPENIAIKIGEIYNDTLLQNLLDLHVDVSEYCSETIIQSDFLPASVKVNCEPEQIVPLNISVYDACNNESSCTTNLSILNIDGPIMVCPDDITLECNHPLFDSIILNWVAQAYLIDYLGNNIFVENAFSSSYISDSECTTTKVKFIASDNCHRSADCSSTITIEDNILPQVICPDPLTVNASDDNNKEIISQWLESAQGSDNCGNVNISNDFDYSIIDLICGDSLAVNIEIEVKDECQNTNNCTTTLHVINDIKYNIECTENLELECGDPANEALINEWINSVFAYNSIGQEFEVTHNIDINLFKFDTCEFNFKVYFQFETPCGLVLLCSNTIVLHDKTKPVIDCPENYLVIDPMEDISLIVNDLVNEYHAFDNCGDPSVDIQTIVIQPNDCDDFASTIIEYTATDKCGLSNTCTTEISNKRYMTPEISCPASIMLECSYPSMGTEILAWIDQASGLDHNGTTLEVQNDFSMASIEYEKCEQVKIVEFNVQDSCGRIARCQSKLIIKDLTAPSIQCPDKLVLNSTNEHYEYVIHEWLNSCQADDACNDINISWDFRIDSFNRCNPGDYNVRFRAIDTCLNENQCNSIIAINPSNPEITCPDTLNIECGNPNSDALLLEWIELAQAYDNSGDLVELTNDLDIASLEENCHSLISVHFFAEDNCGIQRTCSTAIVIQDTSIPVIECGDDITIQATDPDRDSIINVWLEDVYTDDCNGIYIENTMQIGYDDYPCLPDSIIPVNFYVSDECGNRNSCLKHLHFSNDIESHIICPDIIVIECSETEDSGLIESWLSSTSSYDNTGGTFIVSNDYSGIPDFGNCDSEIVVTFQSEDFCSDILSCTSSISIIDNSEPYIQCPPPIICFDQENGHMEEDIMNWLDSVIYNDECNEVKVINNFELDNINNLCIPEYDMNVLFVASDECGNTTECEGKITIISEISPSIICPVPLSLECGSQNNSQVINTWLSTAEGFDFEGNIIDATNSYLNNTPDITGCDIEMEVEFNVTDQCQFSASCKSRIRIKDTQAPLITCPPSLELNSTDSTNSEKIYSWMEKIEYEDSCSEVSVISFPDPTDLDLCNESLIDTIKFTANDQCENSSHCFSEIRINRAGPQLVCPDNLLVDCNSLEDISEEIEFWLNLAHATDNSSSENEVNHDFILADIQKSCDTEFTITFQTTDFCNASTECEAQIKITDTIEPVLDCPPSIQIDIAISSIETIVNNWLLSANASDNCTSIQLTNDFDTGIEEFKCNDQFDVLFKAEDECGNASYCYSELVIISDHELFIECPEPIELQCGEENNESLIYDFMMDYIIESELEYAVYTDIDYVELDLECSEAYIQYVTFHVNDKCDSYDSCESYISFLPAVKVFIPNVFTPNGDGNNERITVFGNEIVEQVQFLTIYDRWGNKIFYQEYFEPNDLSMGWDGRINGSYVQSAVYTYHTVVLDSMGEESQFTGTITLIK